MATPWWAKVPASYYEEPSPVGDAVNSRMRNLRAVLSGTRLRDEPGIAGAFMNANVPISIAMRADAEYRQVKAQKRERMLSAAGMGNAQEQADLKALDAKAKQDVNGFWGQLGQAADTLGDVTQGAVHGLFQGLNAVFSPITVPIAAGRTGPDPAVGRQVDYKGREYEVAPPLIREEGDVPNPLRAWEIGLDRILGLESLSPEQQADMRRAGYDPESFVSRYAWYYSSLEPGQNAVSDDDVREFSQKYDPNKVTLVREIISSNYLNDLNPAALSPAAQRFVEDVNSDRGSPQDKELFERMRNSTTLDAGSFVPNLFGVERGSEPSRWLTAATDLVLFWYADPVAGVVGAGSRALRNARYGFDAGKLASADQKLMKLSKPGDASSAPARGASAAFSRLMDDVDQVHTLQRANTAESLAEAAQITNRVALRTPEMVPHFDVLMGMRSGAVGGVRLRDIDAIRRGAGQVGARRKVDPFAYVEPGRQGVPVWRFRDDQGRLLSQAEQNAAKATVVDRMSEFIWAEALNSGRPLHRGRALLPGEVAFNRRIRSAVAPIRDALIRADQSVYRALDQKTGIVKFNSSVSRADEIVISDKAGQWIADNYTRKWGRAFERAASRFDLSFSGRRLTYDTPEGLESYRRFVTQFMPRRLAYIAVNKWAGASPAERFAQWEQTVNAVVEAAGFRDTKMARELTDMLTKGRVPRQSERDRMGPLSAYSAIRADNNIRAEGHELAAGIYPFQMSEAIILPSMREISQLQHRTGLLHAVTGTFNSRIVRTGTAIWKVGKVANPANMMRQALELSGIGALEQGAGYAASSAAARRFVNQETVKGRLERNDVTRAANKLVKVATGDEINNLRRLFQAGDTDGYHRYMVAVLKGNGIGGRHARILANLNEGVWFDDLAQSGAFDRTTLAMSAGLDMVRRVRLEWMRRTGVPATPPNHIWHHYLDGELDDTYLTGALGDMGAATDGYPMLGGESVVDDMLDAAERGIGGVPARVPNSWDWLGTHGDRGAQLWFQHTDDRLTDEVGGVVGRAVAIEARTPPQGAALTPADIINVDRQAAGLTTFPQGVNSSADIAEWLIRDGAEGEQLRRLAMRLFYTETGKLAEGAQEIAEAQARLAQVMVRDMSVHLGGRLNNGAFTFADEMNGILDQVARGKRVTLRDFAKVPNGARPTEIATPIYVPAVGRGDKKSIVNMAGKLYGFTVARPLERLAVIPAFLANRNIAYRQMEPVFTELQQRGFEPEQVAALLEATASRYAVNATFRYTDHATEHSVFAELTDNFLMFQRANEDFIRRFMKVTAADPRILSRGYLLTEAAQHSGMIYPDTRTDDDGNEETHLVFTFPGSGLLASAVAETGRALGWGDSDLILKPLYSSMSSQLRFVNPSLSNPLGFSTSPLIGMPMRIVRQYFPETDKNITNVLSVLEGGGESYFAEQSVVQSLMPTPLARLVPALRPEDADSQLASAVRNAFVHYGAAGLLPGEDATPDEIEDAHDAIREMATNQLIWRAVVGLFSPMAPQYNEPEGLGLPESTVIDQAKGINTLRGEWFDILQQATKKYGSAQGFGKANEEWARRHPKGESIVNPEVFSVGTSRAPGEGAEAGSVNSGPAITQWMLENDAWIRDNSTVAYYLLPALHDPQYSAAGRRTQLRNGLRVHKSSEEFYRDVRYQIGVREYYDRLEQRSRDLMSGRPDRQVYREFEEWEREWRTVNPATAAEWDRRNDPNYVHAELAPALQRVAESNTAPAGVPLSLATAVWEHYKEYRERYNEVKVGDTGLYDRRGLNSEYRQRGNEMFLGTPAADLWRAMAIYEEG